MLSFVQYYSGVELILIIVAYSVAIIMALTIHEYAHAKVAYNLGDQTPKAQGRLTLNPIAHIDLIGLICLFLVGFGWAKPVQVNPIKFKEYRKGFFKVSCAGVITNLIASFLTCGLYIIIVFLGVSNAQFLSSNSFWGYVLFFVSNLLLYFSLINLCLCLFNLLPFYPLDGYNMLQSFTREGNKVELFLRKYGQVILLVGIIADSVFNINLLSKVLTYIFIPIESFWSNLIF